MAMVINMAVLYTVAMLRLFRPPVKHKVAKAYVDKQLEATEEKALKCQASEWQCRTNGRSNKRSNRSVSQAPH